MSGFYGIAMATMTCNKTNMATKVTRQVDAVTSIDHTPSTPLGT